MFQVSISTVDSGWRGGRVMCIVSKQELLFLYYCAAVLE